MQVQLNNLTSTETWKNYDYLWKSYNNWDCERRKNGSFINVNETVFKDSCWKETSHLNRFDIFQYIQGTPEDIRNEIENIFNTGIITENALSINHIEHFLVASQHLNTLKVACEEKLLRNLTPKNCWELLSLAERYYLPLLRNAAVHHIENGHLKSFLKCPLGTDIVENPVHDLYDRYTALFTINQGRQTVQVAVLDSNQDVRCYRNLKYSKKVSTEFKTCCLHNDKEDSPYVFWSHGKSLSKYDPILNKTKKCKPLKYRRCNFAIVAHGQCCYIIGGTYKGQNIQDVDQFDCKRKTWRKVASLPVHMKTSNLACEATGDLVYIFALDDNNIVVCSFSPESATVNIVVNIPLKFNQMKTCLLGENIYITSDEGNLLKFCTLDNSVTLLQTHVIKIKDFGLFAQNGSIFLVGGKTINGNTSNAMYKFCTAASCWTMLNKTLPDNMSINGICEVKVRKSSNMTIVPFYENNYLEIRS